MVSDELARVLCHAVPMLCLDARCAVPCCPPPQTPPKPTPPGKSPISVDEVEEAAEIMKRFCTGGMSLGAISREVSEL
jgi:glutamate synthase domain-containing protein 2